MSELAVRGCTVTVTPSEGDTITFTQVESGSRDTVKVDSKNAYFDKLTCTVTVTAAVPASCPPPWVVTVLNSPLSIDINGTGSNVLDSNSKAVVKGDEGSKDLSWSATLTTPAGTQSASGTIKVTAKITDAGQTSVIVS